MDHAHASATPSHGHRHEHSHGAVDPALFSTERGMWAVKWSLAGLGLTALVQLGVAAATGSVAVLADTVHNLGDAATAVPLWIAFALSRLKPTLRFTYGYGRAEDLAGVAIVIAILLSAGFAAYESVQRLLMPEEVRLLGVVVAAGLIGFAGNEAVARLRIRVGKEIGSAALEADGQHARADGLTSLAVVAGAAGVALGFQVADAVAGLVISAMILRIGWDSGKRVFGRLLDGVDPEVVEEVREVTGRARGVQEVTEVRARWLGHRLVAEVNLAVDPALRVEEAHGIAQEVEHDLLHHLTYLSQATIHVDATEHSGEEHHRVAGHSHGEHATHSH